MLDLRHETPVDQPFVVLVEEAHGALESRFGGHDFHTCPPCTSVMDSTTAWNGEMLRLTMVCRARIIEASARWGRCLLRVPGMGALGVQRDLELHAAGHHRLRADGDLSGGVVRVVMRADDGLHVIRRAGFHDRAGAQPTSSAGWKTIFTLPAMRSR